MLPEKFKIIRHNERSPWTYQDLDWYQNQILETILNNPLEQHGEVVFSEVAPIITRGRRTVDSDISESLAKSLGIDIYDVSRGGLATYHGPGQWICFIVDRLDHLTGNPRGVRSFVCRFLDATEEFLRSLGVVAQKREGAELGLWCDSKKVAALGIQVKKGVVLHGLSLNITRSETSFKGLRPCGLDLPVGYVDDELKKTNKNISFDDIPREWLKYLDKNYINP